LAAALKRELADPYAEGDPWASKAFSKDISLELSMRHRKSMYL